MNNRDYKIFAPNCYYHIYNRGNGKNPIFLDDEDFLFFLLRLEENLFPAMGFQTGRYLRKLLPANSFTLLCYCLMVNHFHFLLRQDTSVAIHKLIQKLTTSYSKYFNKKYKHIGHVFQGAFKAVKVESDSQLLWLSAYIHQNPKVAGLVENLEDWKWSSYLDYVGLRKNTLCEMNFIVSMLGGNNKYKNFVSDSYQKIKQRKDLEQLMLD